eukprot:CAMPEP_0119485554 /NCGR_PEP_ID=MMETSP1344-20130328/12232_1 /TAXON_ID=236787 /ORGANISM="Florenciella parvula, Strain CCMP2471" /LENGTH=89 /DNA_ID=CAMNT_0007520239 /DNA_START=74 /DNA_END=339 /DNA_ORIENTATION=+
MNQLHQRTARWSGRVSYKTLERDHRDEPGHYANYSYKYFCHKSSADGRCGLGAYYRPVATVVHIACTCGNDSECRCRHKLSAAAGERSR